MQRRDPGHAPRDLGDGADCEGDVAPPRAPKGWAGEAGRRRLPLGGKQDWLPGQHPGVSLEVAKAYVAEGDLELKREDAGGHLRTGRR